MARRIDSLTAGEQVTLKVHNSASNEGYMLDGVYFLGIEGEGEDREALFSTVKNGAPDVPVYRYGNRWAIASDARKVTLVA